jgi:hypothetical protein
VKATDWHGKLHEGMRSVPAGRLLVALGGTLLVTAECGSPPPRTLILRPVRVVQFIHPRRRGLRRRRCSLVSSTTVARTSGEYHAHAGCNRVAMTPFFVPG